MRFIFLFLAAACVLLLPTIVSAEAGWTDYTPVAELVPTSRHYYEVRLPVRNNPSGCTKTEWFYQDYALKAADKMYETLLHALESGKRVRVYVTGKCSIKGYADFNAVSIIP